MTKAQELELKEEFQIARALQDVDQYVRIQGLLLVHRGFRETVAADIIGVGRRTLQDWIHRYRNSGIAGLGKGPYPGGKSKLSDEQKSELAGMIAAGPEKAGYHTGVWIAPMVVELVKKRYGVSYSSSQIARILHDLRFSVQYPTKRPSKADDKAEEEWRTEELPAIKKAEREQGVVLYQDEASFQQSGSFHRSWALVGVGFHVLTPPVRKSAKVMGAVRIGDSPKWHSRFVPWFNGDSFIAFLKQLVRYYDGTKVHLITDNVSYHKKPEVREWLKGKEHLIELHFLPPYAPQLNALEYLWKKTKKAIPHNRYFPKFQDLKQALACRSNRFQGNPASVRTAIPHFA